MGRVLLAWLIILPLVLGTPWVWQKGPSSTSIKSGASGLPGFPIDTSFMTMVHLTQVYADIGKTKRSGNTRSDTCAFVLTESVGVC